MLALAPLRLAIAAEHDVLIVGAGSPELVRKLRAETAYAGLHPVERAAASGAPATLRVLSRERVELSVNGVDPKRRFEQTLVSRSGEQDTFALRVVEQLRARLVDVGWTLPDAAELESPAPEAAQLETAAEAAELESPAPRASRREGVASPAMAPDSTSARGGEHIEPDSTSSGPTLTAARNPLDAARADVADRSLASERASPAGGLWLDAGIASSWASGGLGAVPHAALGAGLDLGARWHARAVSFWPLREARLEADEGEASVAWTGFSATLVRSFPLPPPWLARAGLGAGLILLDARGEARDNFSGRRERLYAGAYLAEASLGRELTGWLCLRATAAGGITAPRPVLRFAEREIASVGRFIGALTLSLELSWPDAEAP